MVREMKLKVMLVDDEPFILQGLAVLIDWEAEGYEIVKLAANGVEALTYLKENKVDLIITDIRMPQMNGFELLEAIRQQNLSEAYVIVLSGYNDFRYVQTALRYSCMDFILKPVKQEDLQEALHRVSRQSAQSELARQDNEKMRRGYLQQNLGAVLQGKAGKKQLEYTRNALKLDGGVRYIHIALDKITDLEELSDEEVRLMRDQVYDNCTRFLGEDAIYLFRDFAGFEEDYEIGFVCPDSLITKYGADFTEFLQIFHRAAMGVTTKRPVVFLVGKRVEDYTRLSHSYGAASVLRSFKGFRDSKPIYNYEEEMQVNQNKVFLCKDSIDRLVHAVEENDKVQINLCVDDFYREMQELQDSQEVSAMNMNYLFFQLIHLAVKQDETVNQEEVMLYISENVSSTGNVKGSPAYLRQFAYEYAEYLIQLRQNASRGILADIEREIQEHYAENLTLRELSQKYYINSSYLGQIFKKKYGQSYKDYLSGVRIEAAAKLLLTTDLKISAIAEQVGYKDLDYFISKFIDLKGCTPAKYRKNTGITE